MLLTQYHRTKLMAAGLSDFLSFGGCSGALQVKVEVQVVNSPACHLLQAHLALEFRPLQVLLVWTRLRFAPKPLRRLYSRFVSRHLYELGAQESFHAQAHIPAQSAPSVQDARFSHADEDQEWTAGSFAPTRQGAQARLCGPWLPRLTRPPAYATPVSA